MLKHNIKLVFSTNALMLCAGVVTSLLSAWALGPAGRGAHWRKSFDSRAAGGDKADGVGGKRCRH